MDEEVQDGEISRMYPAQWTNKQNSALTHREHNKETIRSESERFLIGFYKILINRIFSRIKVSLLHSILGLQLLHLLA